MYLTEDTPNQNLWEGKGVGSWEFFTSSLADFYAHLNLKMNVSELQHYLHIRITWRALGKNKNKNKIKLKSKPLLLEIFT